MTYNDNDIWVTKHFWSSGTKTINEMKWSMFLVRNKIKLVIDIRRKITNGEPSCTGGNLRLKSSYSRRFWKLEVPWRNRWHSGSSVHESVLRYQNIFNIAKTVFKLTRLELFHWFRCIFNCSLGPLLRPFGQEPVSTWNFIQIITHTWKVFRIISLLNHYTNTNMFSASNQSIFRKPIASTHTHVLLSRKFFCLLNNLIMKCFMPRVANETNRHNNATTPEGNLGWITSPTIKRLDSDRTVTKCSTGKCILFVQ